MISGATEAAITALIGAARDFDRHSGSWSEANAKQVTANLAAARLALVQAIEAEVEAARAGETACPSARSTDATASTGHYAAHAKRSRP